ncbi:MAG TPA: hypothetical protein PKC18_02845 [Lacipirellulaceae bacterium]|nr:hypothetical protein [Lacipirellulaceae bacterium]
MCSELLRIPITYRGLPIFGFGVVLALWLAAGVFTLRWGARQSSWAESLRSQLPTLLIVTLLIVVGVPRFFPDGLPLRSYGLMVLAGSVAGVALAMRQARQVGVDPDEIL